LHAVGEYIDQINSGLTKQVLIAVKVYNVSLSREDNAGLDLKAAFKTSHLGLGFQGPGAEPTKTLGATASGLSAEVLAGNWMSSGLLLQALSTQGQASLTTSGSVIAVNGQPAPLQVATQLTYLASSTTNTTANVGTSTTLEPGVVTTGFSANFLPAVISHNRIMLQYSISLSSLLSLNTVKSNGSMIQTPRIATQDFMQRAILHSGQTLVLSGFEQTRRSTAQSGIGSPDMWALGGGFDAQRDHNVLVVAIHIQVL
jgi:type IVB pilus formation R64 PilN family outer membrane protein